MSDPDVLVLSEKTERTKQLRRYLSEPLVLHRAHGEGLLRAPERHLGVPTDGRGPRHRPASATVVLRPDRQGRAG
jgi:hypothetical protein